MNLFTLINYLLPIYDFLFILQKEEYESKRLLFWLKKFFFRRNIAKREKLVLTGRVKITAITTVVIMTSLTASTFYILQPSVIFNFVISIVVLVSTPFFVLIANSFVFAFISLAQNYKRQKAQQKIKINPNLKIVAIAGSYGKTSTKYALYEMIRYTYKTQMIPDNINTPAGITDWINNTFEPTNQVLIYEADCYAIGELAKSCQVAPPDISILLNVADQHLERFGKKEKLAEALSEVITFSKPNSKSFVDSKTFSQIKTFIENRVQKSQVIEIIRESSSVEQSPMYQNLIFCAAVAHELQIPDRFIQSVVKNPPIVSRRQEKTIFLGFDAIDNSYNISATTAHVSIIQAKEYASIKKKKLLVITAGIPELGEEQSDANHQLGIQLDVHSDHAVILKSDFFQEITKGFKSSQKYSIYSSLSDFLTKAQSKFNQEEWVLLILPELNDLYY